MAEGAGSVCHDRHGNTLPGGSWAALPGRGKLLPNECRSQGGHQKASLPRKQRGLEQRGLADVPSRKAGRQVGKASESGTRELIS